MKYTGVVKKGKDRGKGLGFPTANIDVSPEAEEGVFVGCVQIIPEQNQRASLIFIGAAETFDENDKRLEAHILDFQGDLYGQTIGVELLKKFRDNIKFNSKEELIKQMRVDEKEARKYFKI